MPGLESVYHHLIDDEHRYFPFWLNGAELGSTKYSGNQHSADLEEAHQTIFKHANSDQLVMVCLLI